MAAAIERCEIRTIITSRLFIKKAEIPEDPRTVSYTHLTLPTTERV